MLNQSILPKRARRLFVLIAVSAVFLTANGLYLWLFESKAISKDSVVSNYYMGNVLAHLAIGLLFTLLIVLFVVRHIRITWHHENRRAWLVGMELAVAAAVLLGTGVWLMIAGAGHANQWILDVHIAVTFAGAALFLLHRWISSTAQPGIRSKLKDVGIVVGAFVLLGAGHFVSRSGIFYNTGAAPQPLPLAPAFASVAGNKFIPAREFTEVQYCKECHADAYAQWKNSAHSHSSFNDVFYARTVDFLKQHADPNAVRFCAACHDPVILFSGDMENVAKDADFRINANGAASITCSNCHAMQSVSLIGTGKYSIAPPAQYPFAYSTNPFLHFINRLLLNVAPEPHREAFMKPFMKTSTFCAACHKVHIPQAINNYRWQRMMDEYDTWDTSGVAWNWVRSFYRTPKPFTKCAQCHMPQVWSNDAGNVGGQVPSHSFPAANTALAYVVHDTAWLKRTIAFLQNDKMSIDIFALKRGMQIAAPMDRPGIDVVPDETVMVEVVVRNRGVGHDFPGGTTDAQQAWVEFTGKDSGGNEFFHSGWVNPHNQHVDSTAHFFHERTFDFNGNLITTRSGQLFIALLYNHIVSSCSARTVHYLVHVPAGVRGPVTFTAKLHYKKFDEAFTEHIYPDSAMPQFPDVLMAEDSVSLPVEATPLPGAAVAALSPQDRDRFNDYGIGCYLDNDDKDAVWAWRRATELDPAFADGYINLARSDMKEGILASADTDLMNAERAKPGYYKTEFFRGELDKDFGKYDSALVKLVAVNVDYPRDRMTIDEIGRIHYLLGAENGDTAQYGQAIQWYEKELAIDPEDKTPYYNMMLCYQSLGDVARAAANEALWRKYKDDEFQPRYTRRYRHDHPAANNEAQMYHWHEDSRSLMNF